MGCSHKDVSGKKPERPGVLFPKTKVQSCWEETWKQAVKSAVSEVLFIC